MLRYSSAPKKKRRGIILNTDRQTELDIFFKNIDLSSCKCLDVFIFRFSQEILHAAIIYSDTINISKSSLVSVSNNEQNVS